ncbi:hypothetical protein PIB30_000483, partial [Stylosanthes scabra]|nr:hypothetical protein [Stylosanthes scabra]
MFKYKIVQKPCRCPPSSSGVTEEGINVRGDLAIAKEMEDDDLSEEDDFRLATLEETEDGRSERRRQLQEAGEAVDDATTTPNPSFRRLERRRWRCGTNPFLAHNPSCRTIPFLAHNPDVALVQARWQFGE